MTDDHVEKGGDYLIDLKGEDDSDRSRRSENSKMEVVCRICHFGRETELISLGCDCKGELGSSHQHCAEAWFGQKGDRICEICGKIAKNVKASAEERSVFMMEWNEMSTVVANLDGDSHESSRRCKRIFCNLVLAALLLLFLLLWLFRGISLT